MRIDEHLLDTDQTNIDSYARFLVCDLNRGSPFRFNLRRPLKPVHVGQSWPRRARLRRRLHPAPPPCDTPTGCGSRPTRPRQPPTGCPTAGGFPRFRTPPTILLATAVVIRSPCSARRMASSRASSGIDRAASRSLPRSRVGSMIGFTGVGTGLSPGLSGDRDHQAKPTRQAPVPGVGVHRPVAASSRSRGAFSLAKCTATRQLTANAESNRPRHRVFSHDSWAVLQLVAVPRDSLPPGDPTRFPPNVARSRLILSDLG